MGDDYQDADSCLMKRLQGACFFVSALLGWFLGQFSILNALDKRNKNIAVICFIGINIVITALLGKSFRLASTFPRENL